MSFDPITLALAKNYTDEKAGGGSDGGATIGEIVLSDYVVGDTSLNDVVADMAMSGGGVVDIPNGMRQLWLDALLRQPLYVWVDLGGICAKGTVNMSILDNNAFVEGAAFISGGGVVALGGMSLKLTFVLSASNTIEGCTVRVLAEPVEFPDSTST